MTILSEIQKWAEKLPAWQQHAVAVLYERPTPTADDLEDILALLQDAHGIADVFGREARKLTKEQVAAPQAGQSLVQLTAIKNLQYVNALAPGKTLPLAPTGLPHLRGHLRPTRWRRTSTRWRPGGSPSWPGERGRSSVLAAPSISGTELA